ncbi:uncharacterized protein LOC142350400 [Convolutriloba macropyga]|uniref:uncharacterized protein LOC142350400 n=1 Tax=Convolutriloba macropyga TaxID=536237 RepID=UPI003F5252F5
MASVEESVYYADIGGNIIFETSDLFSLTSRLFFEGQNITRDNFVSLSKRVQSDFLDKMVMVSMNLDGIRNSFGDMSAMAKSWAGMTALCSLVSATLSLYIVTAICMNQELKKWQFYPLALISTIDFMTSMFAIPFILFDVHIASSIGPNYEYYDDNDDILVAHASISYNVNDYFFFDVFSIVYKALLNVDDTIKHHPFVFRELFPQQIHTSHGFLDPCRVAKLVTKGPQSLVHIVLVAESLRMPLT